MTEEQQFTGEEALPEAAASEQDVIQESESPPPASPPPEDEQEKNWRETRRLLREQRAKIEELHNAYEQLQQAKTAPQEEEWSITEDEWVTGRDLQKYADRMVKQRVEEQVQSVLKQREQAEVPAKLKSQFSDFESVVTEEALEQLKAEEPELLDTLINSSADPYRKGVAVYKMLKQRQPTATVQQNKQKLQANQATPQPAQANTGSGVLTELASYGGKLPPPDVMSRLYKEVTECAAQL